MSDNAVRYRTASSIKLLAKGPRRSSTVEAREAVPSMADPRDLALGVIQQAISVFDGKQRLQFFNRRYAEIYGLDPSQLYIGMSLREVIDLRYQAGCGPKLTAADYRAWLSRMFKTGRATSTEIVMANGSVYSLHHQPTAGGGFVGTVTDISERRRAESRIEHMAHHDGLTGAPNRVMFFAHLDRAIDWHQDADPLNQRAPRGADDQYLAVMFLDLDHFKDINDTIGHAAGDELLQHVARRMRSFLRDSDVLARLGGDEFAIILDSGITRVDQVTTIAQRVIDAIAQPFSLQSHEVRIGVTIGFTVFDRTKAGASSATLLSQADMALYQAKGQQRGTCCEFAPGMDLLVARRAELERDLRRVVAQQGLEVHYQPMFKLSTGRIIGAEALVRWIHPQFGMVPPSEFIPIAETIGLISELGTWVLRQACARAVTWTDVTVAVNMSPEQVRRPDVVEIVEGVLRDTGLPAHRLELEITEGLLLRDTKVTAEKLNRLRALGIGIALDDFGTGYSSLSYLRRFPFTKLKIDRSFIQPIEADGGTAVIVQAIASLGQDLGMRVIAEGIETATQLDKIRSLGCDEGQGFYLGRPCLPDEFETMLDGPILSEPSR